jgi:hypothetical protein
MRQMLRNRLKPGLTLTVVNVDCPQVPILTHCLWLTTAGILPIPGAYPQAFQDANICNFTIDEPIHKSVPVTLKDPTSILLLMTLKNTDWARTLNEAFVANGKKPHEKS